MRSARRRSERSEPARRRHVSEAEALEGRLVLSSTVPGYLSPWMPSDLPVENPITHQRENISLARLRRNQAGGPLLTNSAKIVTGTDRAGDLWTITVHGPGHAIVNDTTPNDGVLDDDINTIQLVGTNPRKTYVTGLVRASSSNLTDGTVLFNQLIATSGVKSVQLNGFVLSNHVNPTVSTQTGVFLYGGVKTLSFQDIDVQMDQATAPAPVQIVIGNGTRPLKVAPSIYLNNITALVGNSAATTPPTTPITTPSVQFIINGTLQNFDIVSASHGTIAAGYLFAFPITGTTGRTAVQAAAVNRIHVHGAANNLTVSRAAQPFSSPNSGVAHLHRATFDGTADGVGIDVKGRIGKLVFKRGLGSPNGVFTARGSGGQPIPATSYGASEGSTGYPAGGNLGGQIAAKHIHKLVVGPANSFAQTAQNPELVQASLPGWPDYFTTPGYALTNAVVTTSGSIDQVDVTGSALNSEIKTGFDYPSYAAGLEGTRSASRIRRLRVRGSLINSAVSASYRPYKNHYYRGTGTAGRGSIRGTVTGAAYDMNGTTGLGNTGAGVFARHLRGRLPAAV